MTWQHKRYHHNGEPEIAASELKSRESIGRNGTEHYIEYHAENADNKGILEKGAKGNNTYAVPSI
jgi:hypothetical protein